MANRPQAEEISSSDACELISDFNSFSEIERADFVSSGKQFFVMGDVDLAPEVRVLPDNLRFQRHLRACASSLVRFNSTVYGDANFESLSSLREFGPDAKFEGGLDARRTSITCFACAVKANAVLSDIPTLTELAGGASVGSRLDLSGSPVTHFDARAWRIDFDGMVSLVEIGPHSHFGRPYSAADCPIGTITPKMLALVDGASLKGGIQVAVTPHATYWQHDPAAAAIPHGIGKALRTAAALCNSWFCLGGALKNGRDGVSFLPDRVLHDDNGHRSDNLQEAGRRQLAEFEAYYNEIISAADEMRLPSEKTVLYPAEEKAHRL